jgi:ribosomal RNA-processing protein 7
LQTSANTYLAQYTTLEAIRAAQLKQLRSEPDEDGFVTVTRGGRQGPARLEAAQATQERHKERDKKRVGGLFYRFQGREERKKREIDMRRRFEDDVKKIEDVRKRKGVVLPET